jgi:formylglycine-generating enzyme required for sulfatase activity
LTQPQRGPEHDTGSNIPGEPGVAVVEVWRRPLVLAGLAGGLAVLLGLVLLLALRHGTLVVDIDEQLGRDLQVAVSRGGGKPQLLDVKSGWTLSLSAGKYDLAVEGGDDQFLLDAKSITVKRGAEVKVQVTLKPAPPAVAPFDGRQARKYQEHWARQLGVPVEITNSIGMKLVLIPPGEFMMGSPKEVVEEELKAHADDPSYAGRLPGERPWHRVRITKPFYLGTYEVTQEEYQRVIGSNPSEFSATGNGSARVGDQDTKRFPVEMVSWEQAVEFCRKLSNLPEEKSAGRRYRLPAEGQWEYACRAGNMGRFSFSSDRGGIPRESEEQKLFGYGWFNGNSGGTTHAVGEKRAGPWGLYDMHGNVWQWCRDWYDADYYAKSATDDPAGPPAGSHHVARGGSWADPAGYCRSAGRNYGEPGNRHDLGFRVSLGLADEPDGRRAEPSTEDSAPNPQVPPPTSNPPSPTPDSTSPVPPAVPVARPPSPIPSPAAAPFEAAKAKEHQAAWAEYLGLPVETTNSIGMKLVLIPPGEFMMGSPKELIAEELKTEGGWYKDSLPSEEPQHRVRITKPFYLGVTKVTQDEYQRVVGANPSYFSAKGGGKDNVRGQDTKRFPVEEVSWDEAVAFCRKLSQMPGEKAAGRTYRLPSEAQWEYACRAGSTGRFSFSSGQSGIPKEYDENALSDYGWFDGNAAGSTHAVGGKRANAWGLYDVHGNVCEWCRDWYGKDYYAGAATDDPIGPPGGTERVGRGGSWLLGARGCRSAYRTGHSPGDRRDLGLRVCQVLADN